MTCQELNDMYELYTLGVIEGGEKEELEEHLGRKCETCMAGVRRALGLNAFFATLPELVEPPARLRRRVVAAVGEEKAGLGWIWRWVAVAASALAVLVFFSKAAELGRVRAELAGANVALRLLNEPETRQVVFGPGLPRGRVFVNANRGVLLIAGNLPPAPAGRIYELWLIPKSGGPKASGLFQSDAGGNAVYVREGAFDLAATGAVAVTLEPEAGSQAPTTTPVIVAAVGGI